MFCRLVPRPEEKGVVIFSCNLFCIPHKGLLADLTFNIFYSNDNKKNLIVAFTYVLVWALFDPLGDSYFRLHHQMLHLVTHFCPPPHSYCHRHIQDAIFPNTGENSSSVIVFIVVVVVVLVYLIFIQSSAAFIHLKFNCPI